MYLDGEVKIIVCNYHLGNVKIVFVIEFQFTI
jgi:hypothetical protein